MGIASPGIEPSWTTRRSPINGLARSNRPSL